MTSEQEAHHSGDKGLIEHAILPVKLDVVMEGNTTFSNDLDPMDAGHLADWMHDAIQSRLRQLTGHEVTLWLQTPLPDPDVQFTRKLHRPIVTYHVHFEAHCQLSAKSEVNRKSARAVIKAFIKVSKEALSEVFERGCWIASCSLRPSQGVPAEHLLIP
jgi:hypothetical protein